MAPITQASNESNHQELLDKLDLYAVRKPFRRANWKPPQRRNKNVKQIISEAQRKETSASVLATQNNSGMSTPAPNAANLDDATANTAGAHNNSNNGTLTPVAGAHARSEAGANIAQAAQNLSTFVREKNANAAGLRVATPTPGAAPSPMPPTVTYTNIESAPSLHPSSQRHYCDVTGLPAPYTDPKTRLRYHNGEIFGVVRTLSQSATEAYLGARGAHVILK